MALRDLLDSDFVRARNVVPAVLALLFGVFAWFGIGPLLFGGGEDAPPPPEPAPVEVAPVAEAAPEPVVVYPEVLVARRDLEVGNLIGRGDLLAQEWREPLDYGAPEDVFVTPETDVAGSVVVRRCPAGAPVAWDALIPPGGDGFLPAVLTRGARAVTVEADRATTSAGVIRPGGRVDVILVATGVAGPAGASTGPTAQYVVRDARVLAVGSDIASASSFSLEDWAGGAQVAPSGGGGSTFTLEVSPRDAERLSLARVAGELSLAMRPAAPSATPEPFWPEPVRIDEVVPLPAAGPPALRVLRGTQSESVQVSGGESSAPQSGGEGA